MTKRESAKFGILAFWHSGITSVAHQWVGLPEWEQRKKLRKGQKYGNGLLAFWPFDLFNPKDRLAFWLRAGDRFSEGNENRSFQPFDIR